MGDDKGARVQVFALLNLRFPTSRPEAAAAREGGHRKVRRDFSRRLSRCGTSRNELGARTPRRAAQVAMPPNSSA
jgi:hypothetical protein